VALLPCQPPASSANPQLMSMLACSSHPNTAADLHTSRTRHHSSHRLTTHTGLLPVSPRSPQSNHSACVHVLLRHGQEPSFKSRTPLVDEDGPLYPRTDSTPGTPPAVLLAQCGHLELLKELVVGHGLRVTDTGQLGATALHLAALENNVDMCKFLLKHGAQVGGSQ
jgi:hypothetical protein